MKAFFVILRVILAIAAVGMLVWFLIPLASNVFNIGNVAGIALCVWTLVLCSPLRKVLKGKRGAGKALFQLITIVYAVGMLYAAAATTAILFSASSTPAQGSTVIVLGAQVHKSGRPSVILNGRIQAAEQYLNDHPDAVAILTGGQGSDEVKSEADCMYDEMVSDGIDPARLIKEDKATDTAENFRFSQEIIEKNNLSTDLAVVTDGFHQFRAKLIAQKQGFSGAIGAVSADTDMRFVPTYIAREWFALPTVLFK